MISKEKKAGAHRKGAALRKRDGTRRGGTAFWRRDGARRRGFVFAKTGGKCRAGKNYGAGFTGEGIRAAKQAGGVYRC